MKNKISIKETYEKLWEYSPPEPSDNIAENFMKYLEEKIGPYTQNTGIPKGWDWNSEFTNPDIFKGEWYYVAKLVKIYTNVILNIQSKHNQFDWNTRNIGTFYINTLITYYRSVVKAAHKSPCDIVDKNLIDQLHELFTLPGHNVSLPSIAHLYSIGDYRELSTNSSILVKGKKDTNAKEEIVSPPSLVEIKASFISCFSDVTSNNSEKVVDWFHDDKYERYDHQNYKHALPCMNLEKYLNCIEYCTWHRNLFSEWKKEEFLTVMRYSSPQRKILLDPIKQYEQKIADKLFNKYKMKDLVHKVAPVSMAIFCHTKIDGFSGDAIGKHLKVCDDFFPTPSDVGMCLTKNMNLNNVMHIEKSYAPFFEANQYKPIQKIKGGTKWSESTIVIFTDGANYLSKSYPKYPNEEPVEIYFQIHQSKELASLNLETNYGKYTKSLTLKGRHEYFIDVNPKGQVSTSGYKAMGFDQRNCHLEHEVSNSSVFKVYSKKNCVYECYVNKAMETCKCIPWDFMYTSRLDECDVFGRTCFLKTMKNLALSANGECKSCKRGCDFMSYDKVITHSERDDWGSKYFEIDYHSKKMSGSPIFVDYFADENATFYDQGVLNSQNILLRAFEKVNTFEDKVKPSIYQDMVIVHLKFFQPDIDIVTPKYSLMDKIANFGGNFGLFESITGGSLLGIINLCILLFKLLFLSRCQ